MNKYDELPCSILIPRQIVEETSHQPRVIKDFESPGPQKVLQPPAELVRAPALVVAAIAATRKKSCLSKANPRKDPPPHPALRRKTVAFGRTVNVSQTVEGTSRHSKKALTSSSATDSPVSNQKMAEEQPEEDWRDVMKNELETMRKEMQEETTKQQKELNDQNLNKMQEMMTQFFQQITVAKKSVNADGEREKENPYESTRQSRQPKPANKIASAREVVKRDGIIPPEALTIIEQRIRSDPMFRQQIDNVLADAECDANRATYSPPPPLSEARYTSGAGGNPALMRETLTVERSIRYGNGLSSIDSRQWTTERSNNRAHDYRPYEPEAPYHSTYQKGQSISYYPSEAIGNTTRNNRRGYYVEDSSDQEEDVIVGGREKNYHEPVATETAAERERRIREKYARRK